MYFIKVFASIILVFPRSRQTNEFKSYREFLLEQSQPFIFDQLSSRSREGGLISWLQNFQSMKKFSSRGITVMTHEQTCNMVLSLELPLVSKPYVLNEVAALIFDKFKDDPNIFQTFNPMKFRLRAAVLDILKLAPDSFFTYSLSEVKDLDAVVAKTFGPLTNNPIPIPREFLTNLTEEDGYLWFSKSLGTIKTLFTTGELSVKKTPMLSILYCHDVLPDPAILSLIYSPVGKYHSEMLDQYDVQALRYLSEFANDLELHEMIVRAFNQGLYREAFLMMLFSEKARQISRLAPSAMLKQIFLGALSGTRLELAKVIDWNRVTWSRKIFKSLPAKKLPPIIKEEVIFDNFVSYLIKENALALLNFSDDGKSGEEYLLDYQNDLFLKQRQGLIYYEFAKKRHLNIEVDIYGDEIIPELEDEIRHYHHKYRGSQFWAKGAVWWLLLKTFECLRLGPFSQLMWREQGVLFLDRYLKRASSDQVNFLFSEVNKRISAALDFEGDILDIPATAEVDGLYKFTAFLGRAWNSFLEKSLVVDLFPNIVRKLRQNEDLPTRIFLLDTISTAMKNYFNSGAKRVYHLCNTDLFCINRIVLNKLATLPNIQDDLQKWSEDVEEAFKNINSTYHRYNPISFFRYVMKKFYSNSVTHPRSMWRSFKFTDDYLTDLVNVFQSNREYSKD